MAIIVIETDDPDFWPCPEGCGEATDDAAGGPCSACWREMLDKEKEPPGAWLR